MRKFICFCLIFNLFSSISFSQVKNVNLFERRYISLKSYKLKYDKPLTKEDSLNILYHNNDTLVLLKDYKEPKGVRIPYEYKDSIFLNNYKKIAFNHNDNVPSDKTTMKYWKDDLRIYFSKSIAKFDRMEFKRFAKSIIKNIDSLNIKFVRKIEDANYVIYFSEDMEYEPKLVGKKTTNNYMYWKRNNQIFKASIRITKDVISDEVLIHKKLNYLFISSLGYFHMKNDFDCSSYFSICMTDFKDIESFDLELIKYHYSYGICKGTNLKTFEEQHKKAKELLLEKNQKIQFFHRY